VNITFEKMHRRIYFLSRRCITWFKTCGLILVRPRFSSLLDLTVSILLLLYWMLNSHILIFMKVLYHTKCLESCDASSWQKIYSSMHFFKRDVHIARVFLRNKCNVSIPPPSSNSTYILYCSMSRASWGDFQNRYLRFNYRIFFVRNKVTVPLKTNINGTIIVKCYLYITYM
jgi:hypothetical protein